MGDPQMDGLNFSMEYPMKVWIIWRYPYDLGNLHMAVRSPVEMASYLYIQYRSCHSNRDFKEEQVDLPPKFKLKSAKLLDFKGSWA